MRLLSQFDCGFTRAGSAQIAPQDFKVPRLDCQMPLNNVPSNALRTNISQIEPNQWQQQQQQSEREWKAQQELKLNDDKCP